MRMLGWWYRFCHWLKDAPAWRVEYPDGQRTILMRRSVCLDYAAIFGGKVIYCCEDYLMYLYRLENN